MKNLEKEIKTYNSKLPELMANLGKFVLIHGEMVVGTFDTYGDAIKSGYENFADEAFLVKKIAPAEQIHFFTRDLVLECQASL
jgi:hypothetical protein